jgi:hypothetical protein
MLVLLKKSLRLSFLNECSPYKSRSAFLIRRRLSVFQIHAQNLQIEQMSQDNLACTDPGFHLYNGSGEDQGRACCNQPGWASIDSPATAAATIPCKLRAWSVPIHTRIMRAKPIVVIIPWKVRRVSILRNIVVTATPAVARRRRPTSFGIVQLEALNVGTDIRTRRLTV